MDALDEDGGECGEEGARERKRRRETSSSCQAERSSWRSLQTTGTLTSSMAGPYLYFPAHLNLSVPLVFLSSYQLCLCVPIILPTRPASPPGPSAPSLLTSWQDHPRSSLLSLHSQQQRDRRLMSARREENYRPRTNAGKFRCRRFLGRHLPPSCGPVKYLLFLARNEAYVISYLLRSLLPIPTVLRSLRPG
eukprot:748799-Hanusia_phi.AAC.5